MRRKIALALLIAALVPGTYVREVRAPREPENASQVMSLTPIAVEQDNDLRQRMGPFTLEGVWLLDSPNVAANGFSGLTVLPNGQLFSVTDRGGAARFSPPGEPQLPLWIGKIRYTPHESNDVDAEALTYDVVSGRFWVASESSNSINRLGPNLAVEGRVWPPEMRDWNSQFGPEALTRLPDGRFLVIEEGTEGWLPSGSHRALVFAGDPVRAATPWPDSFTIIAPRRFQISDAATLPDGRVLVLLRRLVWVLPFRFEGAIAIFDSAEVARGATITLRQIASLAPPFPTENYEGMAVDPRPDGTYRVWLISDRNGAVTQRTLLARLSLDPAKLPKKSAPKTTAATE